MLPSTVASPAPTSAIAWCQKIRSAAKKTPASAVSRHAPRGRGPSRARSHHASAASGGTANAQRKNADVSGETFARRTRIAEKAIVAAPAIAKATAGRSGRNGSGVLAHDLVERRALRRGAGGPVRGGDELRRVEPDAVIRARQPRDVLLHQRAAEVVDAPRQRLRRRVEAHLHPRRLQVADGPPERQPEHGGVLEVLFSRDLLDAVRAPEQGVERNEAQRHELGQAAG